MDLPSRCVDPVIKFCQECRYGCIVYRSGVECYHDTIESSFDTFCSLGFDLGRPEDEPTSEEIEEFNKSYEQFLQRNQK